MGKFEGFTDNIAIWTLEEWQDCLMCGTDKIRFEYCLGQHGRIRYLRSIQGHSGPNCKTKCEFLTDGLILVITLALHQIADP